MTVSKAAPRLNTQTDGERDSIPANGDHQGDYGVVVDTITSLNAAIANCYHAWGRLSENCASSGSVIYNAQVVCLTASCGEALDSEFTP